MLPPCFPGQTRRHQWGCPLGYIGGVEYDDRHAEARERVLTAFLTAARGDARVQRELEASVPVFFGPGAPVADPAGAWLAARRHAEWFLLERHSAALLGAPAERLLGAVREALRAAAGAPEDALADGALLDAALEATLTSVAGVFEVEEVRAGEGAWLRDVTGLATYALAAPALSHRLVTSDLVVGRLYPLGDGLMAASPAAAVFRGAGLLAALERDLGALRQGPGAKVLHLSQLELERMFFDRGAAAAVGGAEVPAPEASPGSLEALDPAAALAEARGWLVARGAAEDLVDDVLAALIALPPSAVSVTPGLGDALGDALAALAFETDVDLELARAKLLATWRALGTQAREDTGAQRPAAAPQRATTHAAPSDEARARAVDEFARNRAAGRDAAQELAQLREALGLDEDDDEADSPAPDFPGVVGAMVHEFVWETSVTAGEAAARELAPLAHLATFGEPIGVFEELGARDLVRFASFWVIERGVVRDAPGARALLRAVRRFGEWCRDAHEHDVMETLAPALDGLERSLPRVVEANAAAVAPNRAAADEVGDVFEVLDDSAARLRDAAGNEVALAIEPRLRRHLGLGDRLRGHAAAGVLSVVRVYPPEAALGR